MTARRLVPVFVFALVLVMALPLGARAGVRSPMQGTGELEFLADLPVFHDAAGESRVDLSVRVDLDQLAPSGDEALRDRWVRHVLVALKIAREGEVVVDTFQVFRVVGDVGFVDDGPTRRFELLELSAPVPEGSWAATVDVGVLRGDAVSRVRARGSDGSVPAGRSVSDVFGVASASEIMNRRARASGTLLVPTWPASGGRLSDPEFRIRTSNGALPHPERLYGASQDTLEAYVEIAGAPRGRPARIGVEIVDPEFGQMDATVVEVEPRADVDATLVRVPLAALPDGNYVLRLLPQWAEGIALESGFVVSWQIERALQARDDVMLEAELVLSSDEFARFRRLSRPVQVETVQRFWDEHDPTPGTVRNELYDRFLARVAHAARAYGAFRKPGPLTDRGRIYIRYGPPDAIDGSAMPGSSDALTEAIGRVHDTFAVGLEGSFARSTEVQKGASDGPSGSMRAARLLAGGGSGLPDDSVEAGTVDPDAVRDVLRSRSRIGQEAAFELWSYQAGGDPLFGRSTSGGEDVGMRFLFVDRSGMGSYDLEFSNVTAPR